MGPYPGKTTMRKSNHHMRRNSCSRTQDIIGTKEIRDGFSTQKKKEVTQQ